MTNKIATYKHSRSVDEKGRVYASALRQYGSDLVIATSSVFGGFDNNCLYLCPKSEFEKRVKTLIEKCPNLRAIQRMERWLGTNSAECRFDSDGRIKILENLRRSIGMPIGMPTSVSIKELYEVDKILKICYEKE